MSQKSKTEGVRTSLVLSEHASTVRRPGHNLRRKERKKKRNVPRRKVIPDKKNVHECVKCPRHFSGVKKKRCTLSLKVFLLPVTFFKDFTEAGISKMICPFILHYTKKDMIKIGAHIKPIASATTLHIPYSLHSTPIKEAKHGNLSISEEYWSKSKCCQLSRSVY